LIGEGDLSRNEDNTERRWKSTKDRPMRRVLWTSCAVAAVVAACVFVYASTRPPRPQIRMVNQFLPGRRGERISPHETTKATIGGADIAITYGRPSMRGRTIFGGLVPYGDLWCPGADEATMVATSHALRFAGLTLDAGEYSLWMLPAQDRWTLTFNSDAHTFHVRHDRSADVGTIDLNRARLATPVEQLTFTIENDPAARGGVLVMSWERTRVSAPFTVGRQP
jgi:hypothetical protein